MRPPPPFPEKCASPDNLHEQEWQHICRCNLTACIASRTLGATPLAAPLPLCYSNHLAIGVGGARSDTARCIGWPCLPCEVINPWSAQVLEVS